jgi:Asp-tRNA(Asn)/Glu-tRNA(Gln) amidotransferase A subunit family amidase
MQRLQPDADSRADLGRTFRVTRLGRDPLHRLTAVELLTLLRAGECSVREVTESCLARIVERDTAVCAFVDVDVEGALRQAAELDVQRPRGLLHGIPTAVKETVDVAGLRCTLGTPVHRSRIPARDATVVQRLRRAGAVIVGTTVSTEYAIARAGPTRNPHDLAHTPGGSSSGSAAAVACGMVPIAVGTQTVGSIVRPATYCGIFGLKPTKDAISTTGVMPLSAYLDHVGPLARTAADIALACRVVLEADGGLSLSSGSKPNHVLRIEGPMRERIEPPTWEALNRAQASLEASGIPVREGRLPPMFADVVSCYETILFRDIAINHGRDRDESGEAMSARLRQIIDYGRTVSDRDYDAAMGAAQSYRQELLKLLGEDAVILAPATDGSAPLFSEETGPSQLQGLWTLAGLPALAVPCGKVAGLAVGVQLIAARGRDDLVLGTAAGFMHEWPAEPIA